MVLFTVLALAVSWGTRTRLLIRLSIRCSTPQHCRTQAADWYQMTLRYSGQIANPVSSFLNRAHGSKPAIKAVVMICAASLFRSISRGQVPRFLNYLD